MPKVKGHDEGLRVRDDGQGFPGAESPHPSHYGLAMMAERAAEIGAELDVQSHPGAGTNVFILCKVVKE